MKFTYCPTCGDKLGDRDIGDEGLVRYCNCCDKYHFDTPISCVVIMVVNEFNQIILLKQNYISKTHWTFVSGYVKNGETLEETVSNEVFEETGQRVNEIRYVNSYYYEPKQLIMAGFIAFVDKKPFGESPEVDDIMWCNIFDVDKYIARGDNLSGLHFDNSMKILQDMKKE